MFGTGVYWSSWGSPLQRFLEVMTAFEVSDIMLGKPAGVVVTMDSVGGSEVAQRLLGVLSMMGFLVPPLSMVVVSRVGTQVRGVPGNEDVWQTEDVAPLVQNLVHAMRLDRAVWQAWPVERTLSVSGAYPQAGVLDLGVPFFLAEDELPTV